MNVLVTVILIAVLGVWWFAVYNRLLRLRERVREAWHALEPNQVDDALRAAYNARVTTYNDALAAFPANVVALVAGFKSAHHF